MKPLVKLLIPLLFSAPFLSCAALLGIKDPAPVSLQYVEDFYEKHDIDLHNFYVLQDGVIDSMRLARYKGMFDPGFRALQFRLFDTTGYMITSYSTCEGGSNPYALLESFPPRGTFPSDTTYHLSQELHIAEFSINAHALQPQAYTLVIYTQTYSGVLGARFCKKLLAYAHQYKIPNVLLMNGDYIEAPEE